MKKRLFSMLLATTFAMVSGSFVSCDDSNDADQPNTLKVTPSSSITLAADANQDVVLTVETDAKSWSFDASEWILATQEGNKLKVNAEANVSESARPGRITIMAGNAEPVKINVLQEGVQAGEIVLSVTPSEAIEFEAKDNQPVVLTVTTNAADWTFTVPEWLTADKQDNTLTVNAKDNTSEANVGQIVIKTDDGEKSVRIAVTQKAGNGQVVTEKVAGALSCAEELAIAFEHDATAPVKKVLTFTLDQAAAADVLVKIVLDEQHVEEYNFDNNTEHVFLPAGLCTVANDGVLTVKAGETTGTVEVTITPDADQIAYVTSYMVPLQAVAESENVEVKAGSEYVDMFVTRKSSKTIRNICYFEVNDCNPLNAIEYILEDGQPFFDAVVLFAGNINWSAGQERVIMSANPNVQALLDNSEELLQPLRKKGIKVLLDILGNHDRAGVAGLSDYGCEQFGKELAQICLDYKLDGIGFDDEYSSYYTTAPTGSAAWFTSPSSSRAARLLYETKKAMTELCPWETWIHLYYLGYISSGLPSVTIDGVEYKPSEFVDNVCADYGQAARPVNGMDLSGCAGTSLQMNYGYTITSARAQEIMNDGYGWIMWFAFDPSGTGTVGNNRANSFKQFCNMAEGCYNQSLQQPKYVYNKLGEGSYDPTPHPIN